MKEIFGLEGEPALVVGGGYGSGRETAHLLARAGAKVAIVEMRRNMPYRISRFAAWRCLKTFKETKCPKWCLSRHRKTLSATS